MSELKNREEIKVFREYLQIPTVHPDIDYEPAIIFLKRLAADIGLPVQVCYPKNPKKPILLMAWPGTDPNLESIFLNSHMDVVPVDEAAWDHPPFAAHMDDEGNIYARGTQDVKCLGIQNYFAIKELIKEGFKPLRTVYLSFSCEEEKGGEEGMMDFVRTEEFKRLKVGFAMDEGGCSPEERFPVFFAERSTWYVTFKCNGTPGHGSLLHKNTAGEKLNFIISKMMNFRAHEIERLERHPEMLVSNVTTVNLTMVSGGLQANVVPSQLSVTFDMRIAIDVDHQKLEGQLRKWCEEAGEGVELVFGEKREYVAPTKCDEDNRYWCAFKAAVDEMKLRVVPVIAPGGTDSRYIRALGIPALGFTPINHTAIRLHDHNEYLGAETFLRGIQIMKNVIKKVTSVE
ncbi:aminoacylase-1-like [Culicoides brevitarsis]|uniref:aminoacylase-1-like n=1 Tax=Culicoides brevitarsis TaxID=469753 RepID=UPI00307BF99C